jgi:calcineurin-like phosphoesterase family protein
MDPIRWLHLSDLHLGCRGTALWSQVHEEFEQSIRKYAAEIGMPDLILFTGDLTFKGSVEEFEQVDEFLQALQGWLMVASGSDRPALVFPVPGNHDLVRPVGRALRNLRFLEHYYSGSADPDIAQFQQDLWVNKDEGNITPLFSNYQAWLERSILPQFQGASFKPRCSHFPGDLSVVYRSEGKPSLLLVGLDSAWMQYLGGDLQRKLELPIEQFHAALGAQGLGSLKEADQALLLMHHPLDWLSQKAQEIFLEDIYTPSRFTLCLHGHMHKGRSSSISEYGGAYRHWFQSPSLFGVEHYGASNENRAIGYAWGELDADGQVRVWPLRRDKSGGEMVFVHDRLFRKFPAIIRPPSIGGDQEQALRPSVDIEPWLEQTLALADHIDIRGIGSGAGKVRSASRYPIERLYTQLRCREPDMGSERGLEALLPRHRLLLIEGQPGAGKTTFLRFTAALLARDRLGRPGPDGGTWRERYLGMDSERWPPLPILLRLALVEQLLGKVDPKRLDNRERLLDLILSAGSQEDRAGWQAMFKTGEVLLLLDGMDEIADEIQRGRVFAILRDVVTHWKKTRVVLTSRPIDTRPLIEMGFSQTEIEPFAKPQIVM